ncbi:hypothetical protein BDY21DRAFT_271586, partial [Lineolata rhizophorae]
IVVASLRGDDTAWIGEHLPEWGANVYVMDDALANLSVPVDKGREGMAYLTYIIDRYDDLPDVIAFSHSARYQWHNDDPLYDGVPVLSNLRLSHVLASGYVSLRCAWALGCPAELRPRSPTRHSDDFSRAEAAFADAYRAFFPADEDDDDDDEDDDGQGGRVPEAVGAPCGAQFAVSRDQVRRRRREDYVRMRRWVVETRVADGVAAKVLENLWHIVMGKPPVYCPPARDCYCAQFGHCGLRCPAADACDNRYILPDAPALPDGWPF